MSPFTFNPRTSILLVYILILAIIRVLFNFSPDISRLVNFSSLGAMALFGGAYFNGHWKGFAFPLLTLFISDFILHRTVFKSYGNGFLYSGWYWVYGAFALITVTGKIVLKKVSTGRFVIAALACVLIHWIVTDFGVWMGSSVYTHDIKGFADCLIAAIPYEWRFLAGTLVYGTILFGSFELMKRKYYFLQRVPYDK